MDVEYLINGGAVRKDMVREVNRSGRDALQAHASIEFARNINKLAHSDKAHALVKVC